LRWAAAARLRAVPRMGVPPPVAFSVPSPTMDVPLHFGMTAGERAWLPDLGPRLEALGFAGLWSNDNPGRSGLATLATASVRVTSLDLGLGVAPLSARSPGEIAGEVRALGLDPRRLLLGVGSGRSASLALVRDGVAELRRLLPGTRIGISALGPRMCRLAGEVADFVLLNWAEPGRVAWARERVAEGAAAAGRPAPVISAYVRMAVGPGAVERLAQAAAGYGGRPGPYARLFADQGRTTDAPPGVAAIDPASAPGLLARYRGHLDLPVVRAVPDGDDLAAWCSVAEAAAGGPGGR
jgi:alkanesulfonate monooxygenase SsuD/methylene tetrahydromethanopterin reductase-like flavin-dependent oxidoreductase (luciferase family)